jgi:lipoprotein-anchoring transpeptidase ErfK/SrfK
MTTVRVSIAQQTVEVIEHGRRIWAAPVSTARAGTGCQEGSLQTPLGRFTVAEKIGDGAPLGAIFKSRVPTGEIWTPGQRMEEDLILTRILWLDGAEPHNANTKARYIYFHGTNHEAEIGTPASHGCIRLRNADMLHLFDLVAPGTPVEITQD